MAAILLLVRQIVLSNYCKTNVVNFGPFLPGEQKVPTMVLVEKGACTIKLMSMFVPQESWQGTLSLRGMNRLKVVIFLAISSKMPAIVSFISHQ